MTIHVNAKHIGTLQFDNGYQNQLWLSYNHNTGDPIIWQRVKSPKTNSWTRFKRMTGKNIAKAKQEMAMLFDSNRAIWAEVNQVFLDAFNNI